MCGIHLLLISYKSIDAKALTISLNTYVTAKQNIIYIFQQHGFLNFLCFHKFPIIDRSLKMLSIFGRVWIHAPRRPPPSRCWPSKQVQEVSSFVFSALLPATNTFPRKDRWQRWDIDQHTLYSEHINIISSASHCSWVCACASCAGASVRARLGHYRTVPCEKDCVGAWCLCACVHVRAWACARACVNGTTTARPPVYVRSREDGCMCTQKSMGIMDAPIGHDVLFARQPIPNQYCPSAHDEGPAVMHL